jgi:hypothetical protein
MNYVNNKLRNKGYESLNDYLVGFIERKFFFANYKEYAVQSFQNMFTHIYQLE